MFNSHYNVRYDNDIVSLFTVITTKAVSLTLSPALGYWRRMIWEAGTSMEDYVRSYIVS